MSVRELPELPSLVPLFAKAVLPSLDRGPARIPGDTVLVRGVGQDLGRLADYDRVCGFGLSEVVPPTWLHVLTFGLHIELLSGRDSTIRLAGVVHVSNRMRLHRPVVVHVDGELVWDGVSTYLAPGAKVPGTDEQLAREEYVPTTPNAVWRLPADLGRQYRAVSGDPNPIHTSRLAARAFGFARPIIHGMWTHARLLAAVQPRLPDAYAVEVGFARPILLPGTVGAWWRPDAGGWVAAVTDRAGAKPYLTARITPSP